MFKMPVPDKPAKLAGKPLSANVGLPDAPEPFVTLKPLPETAIERFVTVDALVLATNPLAAASKLPEAPFNVIVRVL
jgi:hypothetical protein